MDKETGIYVGLGSNLGFESKTPRDLISEAVNLLSQNGITVTTLSSLWTSKAWPADPTKPDYINAVCRVLPKDTSPLALLNRLHDIEAQFSRARPVDDRWASRTLDLDILDYNGQIWANHPGLCLPHPRICERDFVLRPLLEIAPDWTDPVSGQSGQVWLAALEAYGRLNQCEPIAL
jgi:2-amino-4-hydroxy-6-hydroxymethyldihydropteridine diphosphokinase